MKKNWLDNAYKDMRKNKSVDEYYNIRDIDPEGKKEQKEYKQNLIEIILDLTDKYSITQLKKHNIQILTQICDEEVKQLKQ